MAKIVKSKKDIERWQLDRFASICPTFPAGPIISSEEPDFIVVTKKRKIGIELTDLYWQTINSELPRQSQETLWSRIVNVAERDYSKSGLTPLYVTVTFNQKSSLKKKDVERISTGVFDVVIRNVPLPGQNSVEEYDWDNRMYFPEEIARISVCNIKSMTESFFCVSSTAFIPTLSSEDISRIMSSKESKLEQYMNACDEVWLLVNYDCTPFSTFFKIDESVISLAYDSGFNRVFFMGHQTPKIYELNIRRTR